MNQLFNIFKFIKKMNNNLKICLTIYITMSAIPNLEVNSASEKRATSSSDIPRFYKDEDEIAVH
jgi:hypothetical protein